MNIHDHTYISCNRNRRTFPLVHRAACLFFHCLDLFILKSSFTALTVFSRGNPKPHPSFFYFVVHNTASRKRFLFSPFNFDIRLTSNVDFIAWKKGLLSSTVCDLETKKQFPLIVTPHEWTYSFLSHNGKFLLSANTLS